MMSKIRVLPDHISNLIAAGEVVERPASVAKELVENAIDAGATRIVIDVESGGRRLLKITDDGEGMTRDDAVLAFERHATSKISKAEDLNAIGTLGFRGEALASIALVTPPTAMVRFSVPPSATEPPPESPLPAGVPMVRLELASEMVPEPVMVPPLRPAPAVMPEAALKEQLQLNTEVFCPTAMPTVLPDVTVHPDTVPAPVWAMPVEAGNSTVQSMTEEPLPVWMPVWPLLRTMQWRTMLPA